MENTRINLPLHLVWLTPYLMIFGREFKFNFSHKKEEEGEEKKRRRRRTTKWNRSVELRCSKTESLPPSELLYSLPATSLPADLTWPSPFRFSAPTCDWPRPCCQIRRLIHTTGSWPGWSLLLPWLCRPAHTLRSAYLTGTVVSFLDRFPLPDLHTFSLWHSFPGWSDWIMSWNAVYTHLKGSFSLQFFSSLLISEFGDLLPRNSENPKN